MPLTGAHRRTLESESGISPDVVAERGYRTVAAAELAALGFSKAQCLAGLLIPVWGVDGGLITHQLRPDAPRVVRGKPLKYETPAKSAMHLDVPKRVHPVLGDPTTPLWITEGAKKADAAASRGIACIALLGVWNWRGTNDKGGKTELAEWEKIAFNGRTVYVAFDSDVMEKEQVQKALHRLAGMITRRGGKVRYVLLPAGEGQKVGLDDYFVRGGTVEELVGCAVEKLSLPGSYARSADGLPGIVAHGRQLRHIADEALDGIRACNVSQSPILFSRGGVFCQLKPDEGGGVVSREVRPTDMVGILTRTANWLVTRKEEEVACLPPRTVAEMLVSEQRIEGFPKLEGVVMAPILDRSYSILSTPGYHPSAGVYYHEPSGQPILAGAIPRGLDAVRSAVDELVGPSGIFGEFPYADDASRANALAYLLTPFVRYLIEGPTPLYWFNAPTPGTGKSLLATSMAAVFSPVGVAVNTVPNTKEEWPKLLGAVLSGGSSHVIFDNAKGRVEAQEFDAAVTGWPLYEYRVLGISGTRKVSPRCVWALTANNAHTSEDFARRCVTIQLDARTERPDERKFKRNIYEDMRENRGRYVLACLTIIAHWADAKAAGKAGKTQEYDGVMVGSYESYIHVMDGILRLAQVPGFLANRDETRRNAAPDVEIWKAFYNALHQTLGVGRRFKAKDAVQMLDGEQWGELRDDLATVLPGKPDALTLNIGRKLASHVGRVFGGVRLTKGGARAGSTDYQLELVPLAQAVDESLKASISKDGGVVGSGGLFPNEQEAKTEVCDSHTPMDGEWDNPHPTPLPHHSAGDDEDTMSL
jgi:hypothetical protein